MCAHISDKAGEEASSSSSSSSRDEAEALALRRRAQAEAYLRRRGATAEEISSAPGGRLTGELRRALQGAQQQQKDKETALSALAGKGGDEGEARGDGRGEEQGQRRPQLPEGWEAARDPETGEEYYYHVETERTQWEFPTEEDGGENGGAKKKRRNKNNNKKKKTTKKGEEEEDGDLPVGWRRRTHAPTGQMYFENELTGERSRDRPVGPAKRPVLVQTGAIYDPDAVDAEEDLASASASANGAGDEMRPAKRSKIGGGAADEST